MSRVSQLQLWPPPYALEQNQDCRRDEPRPRRINVPVATSALLGDMEAQRQAERRAAAQGPRECSRPERSADRRTSIPPLAVWIIKRIR